MDYPSSLTLSPALIDINTINLDQLEEEQNLK